MNVLSGVARRQWHQPNLRGHPQNILLQHTVRVWRKVLAAVNQMAPAILFRSDGSD